MIFNSSNLLFYLIEKGLITREAAVDGPLLIVDASSRNRNFKVLAPEGGGVFVKQAQEWDAVSLSLLEREATTYRLAETDRAFESLADLVPRLHRYDQARHALVVDLLEDGEDLSVFHRRVGRFPVDAAAQLGQALAAFHHIQLNGHSDRFPQIPPWVLSADQLKNDAPSDHGTANEQVLQIIAQYPEFHRHLAAIRGQWQQNSFIHGDMKWENCLLRHANDRPEFRIIDWETADIGDAAWDTGAIFQAYLTFWIMSIPVDGSGSLSQLLDQARYPIEAMQPAIAAFWQSYAAALHPLERQQHLLRATNYAAVRMCQTAYEYMAHSPQITLNGLGLLQVSMNMLEDPLAAAAELLSLEIHGG